MKKSLSIDTPLGTIVFESDISSIEKIPDLKMTLESFPIETIVYSSTLGYAIVKDNCYAILLVAENLNNKTNIEFTATLLNDRLLWSGNNGEGLDSFECENDEYVVQIGTEDGDYLGNRLNMPEITIDTWYLLQDQQQLKISLTDYPHSQISLHYILTWSDNPEINSICCWYAVDYPHNLLLKDLKSRL